MHGCTDARMHAASVCRTQAHSHTRACCALLDGRVHSTPAWRAGAIDVMDDLPTLNPSVGPRHGGSNVFVAFGTSNALASFSAA
eukprot:6089433-Prymnesium_polylepis.1